MSPILGIQFEAVEVSRGSAAELSVSLVVRKFNKFSCNGVNNRG